MQRNKCNRLVDNSIIRCQMRWDSSLVLYFNKRKPRSKVWDNKLFYQIRNVYDRNSAVSLLLLYGNNIDNLFVNFREKFGWSELKREELGKITVHRWLRANIITIIVLFLFICIHLESHSVSVLLFLLYFIIILY